MPCLTSATFYWLKWVTEPGRFIVGESKYKYEYGKVWFIGAVFGKQLQHMVIPFTEDRKTGGGTALREGELLS